MNNKEKSAQELHIIDSLLQNEQYAEEMAAALDASYYKGIGQTPPPFLAEGEDSVTVNKSVKEEKIATSIAGFYALECGLGYLCDQTKQTPVEWLQKVINKKADDSAIALLNRFANATWKAGQPFRGMERIKKANFISWSELSKEEVEKDTRQIVAAASRLSMSLKQGTMEEQMQQLRTLLHDTDYALHMAAFIDSMYSVNEQQAIHAFIKPEGENAVKAKKAKDEKIATNLAGFYATECATNYLATTNDKTPSEILQSLVDNTMSKQDKMIYARFANATWKAGQPFRSLNRISRETFTPFYFLSEADIDKDLAQVRAAAAKLLQKLKPL